MTADSTGQMVDHLFRHEAGKMVAVLSRIFGIHRLELAEDVVQEAFIKALQCWRHDGLPNNPSAWLMQVARRKAIDVLRKEKRDAIRVSANGAEAGETIQLDHLFLDHEISDSQLRLMFACCHPALKPEDQIALTLKTASGFGVREIARALLVSDDAVKQRLSRARSAIRKHQVGLDIPLGEGLHSRLHTMLTVLYLIYNEGYNTTKSDEVIRRDLCAEAMRLTRILSEHQAGHYSGTFALLSLMCFQSARFDARLDSENQIILLADQDRKAWNKQLVSLGNQYLQRALATDDTKTVYHIEAAIAANHTFAPSFEATDWNRLLKLYSVLVEVKPTPVVELNMVIVLLQLGQIRKASERIDKLRDTDFARSYYLFHAVAAEVYRTKGDREAARSELSRALELTSGQAERQLLRRKLRQLDMH